MRHRINLPVVLGLFGVALGMFLMVQLLGQPAAKGTLTSLTAEETAGAESAAFEQEGPMSDPTLAPDLPDLGPAPELENEVWLNTEAPLHLADLRGQVVALEMWTFG